MEEIEEGTCIAYDSQGQDRGQSSERDPRNDRDRPKGQHDPNTYAREQSLDPPRVQIMAARR